jgi:hypothetical protein
MIRTTITLLIFASVAVTSYLALSPAGHRVLGRFGVVAGPCAGRNC